MVGELLGGEGSWATRYSDELRATTLVQPCHAGYRRKSDGVDSIGTHCRRRGQCCGRLR